MIDIKDEKGEKFGYNIVLIGSGATGSQLLPFLTQLLNNINHTIKIIDGDLFEAKNMKNQKCLERDLGHAKSEVLCERYQGAYPSIDISYVDEYIRDKDQVINHLKSRGNRSMMPILISCVDNNATRKIFNEVFYDERLPDLIYIDSGNGTTDRRGQIVTGLKIGERKQVPPYESFQTDRLAKDVIWGPVGSEFPAMLEDDAEPLDKLLSCSYVSNESPQNIATNVMAASTIFCILNNIIAFDKLTSHINYFDAETVSVLAR